MNAPPLPCPSASTWVEGREKGRAFLLIFVLLHLRLLLLDEPSNALDLAAQYDLRAMLRKLAQAGTAILLVTHHVGDILPEIDRVLMMREGRVVADGAKSELLNSERMSELFGRPVVIEEIEGFYHAR